MMRIRRVLTLGSRAIGTVAAGVALLIAFPDALFAHTLTTPHIAILSDHPIDEIGARAVVADVEARLARSPLPIGDGAYRLIVTNEEWRRHLLFAHVYGVGGVAFYPVSRRHVFLSGADFAHDRLISPSGQTIEPPRTLGYYGAHEIAHVLTGERAGAIRFHMMPTWAVEGLADYCALGSPGDLRAFDAKLGRAPITVEQMKQFGVYPRWRMMVAFLLEERKWTLQQLLASDLSEEDVLKMLRGEASS